LLPAARAAETFYRLTADDHLKLIKRTASPGSGKERFAVGAACPEAPHLTHGHCGDVPFVTRDGRGQGAER